jgi:hypothetical protein
MKASGNYRRYLDEFDNCEETTPEIVTSPNHRKVEKMPPIIQHYQRYDQSFPSEAKMAAQSQLEVLEGRLSTAQAHINKESIRTALLALGEFHRGRGELREGWRRVVRSR